VGGDTPGGGRGRVRSRRAVAPTSLRSVSSRAPRNTSTGRNRKLMACPRVRNHDELVRSRLHATCVMSMHAPLPLLATYGGVALSLPNGLRIRHVDGCPRGVGVVVHHGDLHAGVPYRLSWSSRVPVTITPAACAVQHIAKSHMAPRHIDRVVHYSDNTPARTKYGARGLYSFKPR